MSISNRTVEIDVVLRDQTSGKLGNLKKQLDQLDQQAQRLSNRFRALALQKFATTIRLIDRVTEPATRINNLLKRLAGGVYRVSIRLNDGALAGIRKVESALMRISSKVYNVAVNVKGGAMSKLSNLTSGAMMAAGAFMPGMGALGGGYLIGNAIKSAIDFEKQMSKVQAVRQLTKNSPEMQALIQQAKDLGATTAWTRKQVGEAQYYQALAGWDTKSIQKATPHILNLASASGTDLGRTSDIVTDTMTAFNLKATDVYQNKQGKWVDVTEHYADLFAKMQAVSNTTVEQAAGAMRYSANLFGAQSMNLHGQDRVQKAMEMATDAAVMTALLANAGIKESMAGTGESNFMQRITSGNRNALYALQAMGVQVEDANHNLLSPEKIVRQISDAYHNGFDLDKLGKFEEAMAGVKIHADTRRKLDKLVADAKDNGGKMGTADMMQLATMLAGAEHAQKLMALIMGDWDDMEQKLTNVEGTAAKSAKDMLDNLAGSLVMLDSAWDAFSQDLFTTTAGDGLRNFVDALTEIITRAQNLFKDGIDLPDIAKIIGDVVSRLKNKFLELDGVGSILAGGALFMGLRKIAALTQNITSSMRTIGKNGNFGLNSAQKVGNMTISAGVVNVNGRVNGTGAGGLGSRNVGNQAIIDNYYRTKAGFSSTPPSIFSGMKSAAGGAMAFAGVFSMLDILSTKSINAERLANAPESERAQIMRENRQAEWLSAGGALGSIAFAGLGAALGSMAGPMGTAIGGIVGGMIGEKFGQIAGEKGFNLESSRHKTNDDLLNKIVLDNMNNSKPDQTDFSFGAKKPLNDFSNIIKVPADIKQTAQNIPKSVDETFQARIDFWNKDLAEFKKSHMPINNFSPIWQGNSDMPGVYRANQTYDPSDLFFNRAEAAELNDEQMAQMEAMERGEFYQPQAISEQIAAQNEAILESFNGLGEQITESLSAALEGAGEVFSTFGEGITEGLTSTFEGAGEVLSNFGETISSGMESAQNAATSSLESIQNSFTNAKLTIESTWNELPGFFSGVFSGLGGAAEAAGSAIYAGLTSVIGSIIGAWQGAASTIAGIISSIGSTASSAISSAGAAISGVLPAHAEGGFVTSPELSWVGERGAELILPLTDRRRSMELLSQASGILGLDSGSDNVSGGENFSSGSGVTINLGGVNFNISSDSPSEIMNALQGNIQELSDKIALTLAQSIQSVHKNQPLHV